MRTHYVLSDHRSSVSRYRGWCVLTALALLGSAGCSEATTEQVEGPVSVSIEPSELNLFVGDVATLTAVAFDAKQRGMDATFTWASGNPAVATVTSAGVVTAVGHGGTVVTARAGAVIGATKITVQERLVAIRVSPVDMVLGVGAVDGFTALGVTTLGLTQDVAVEWSSSNPAIATVAKYDGIVAAIAIGSTTVTATLGSLRATANVTVEAENYLAQWASGASASSQYTADEWSAGQATGAPNVFECEDHPFAWASLVPALDWLEVTYAQPVRPAKIHIYENWAVGSIVKVEVRDVAGDYHDVYSALPVPGVSCPRVLAIDVTNVTAKVVAVRVTVDQKARNDWAEIDAVRLSGYR
ncbi:MAG TPA: Ig-like domain-containing protein [Gemmatimonadaceae bacterium]|jgi:hypothetical protein|nr:Ig-like domain-containing protein [Gemmatimonadaceae bacterium]